MLRLAGNLAGAIPLDSRRGPRGTLADSGHLAIATVTVVLMFPAMAFGAAAFGKWFHGRVVSQDVDAFADSLRARLSGWAI